MAEKTGKREWNGWEYVQYGWRRLEYFVKALSWSQLFFGRIDKNRKGKKRVHMISNGMRGDRNLEVSCLWLGVARGEI